MKDTHQMLRHFLATLAYRTQKAVRGAPEGFADLSVGNGVRTPHELVCHMTSVLGYARAQFTGETTVRLAPCDTWGEELERFHAVLADLSDLLDTGAEPAGKSLEVLLQGPFSDAMTHAGQMATLRRLAGSPVEPENFMKARIEAGVVGQDQPLPDSSGR